MTKEDAIPMLIPPNQEVGRIFYEKIALCISMPRPRILEVGCGYGIAATYVRQLAEKLTLIDVDAQAVEFMSHAWSMDKQVTVLQGTIQEVRGCFDIIYYFLSLHHIPAVEAELTKVRDLLSAGGQLFLCELLPIPGEVFHRGEYSPRDGFVPDELFEHLKSCHYDVVEFQNMTTISHNLSTYTIYLIQSRKQVE